MLWWWTSLLPSWIHMWFPVTKMLPTSWINHQISPNDHSGQKQHIEINYAKRRFHEFILTALMMSVLLNNFYMYIFHDICMRSFGSQYVQSTAGQLSKIPVFLSYLPFRPYKQNSLAKLKTWRVYQLPLRLLLFFIEMSHFMTKKKTYKGTFNILKYLLYEEI